MRQITGMCIILAIGVAALAKTVNLSGTVKDGKGAAIAGAAVTLVSDTSMKDITNASGEFAISNITGIQRGAALGISAQNTNRISIKGNQLRFFIASHADKGVVSIFSSNGKRSVAIPLGKMESGIHRHTLPELSPGFYVMHITIDKSTTAWNLVITDNEIFMSDEVSGVKSVSGLSRSVAAASVDTLAVKKDGFTTIKKEIASYEQKSISIVI